MDRVDWSYVFANSWEQAAVHRHKTPLGDLRVHSGDIR